MTALILFIVLFAITIAVMARTDPHCAGSYLFFPMCAGVFVLVSLLFPDERKPVDYDGCRYVWVIESGDKTVVSKERPRRFGCDAEGYYEAVDERGGFHSFPLNNVSISYEKISKTSRKTPKKG